MMSRNDDIKQTDALQKDSNDIQLKDIIKQKGTWSEEFKDV